MVVLEGGGQFLVSEVPLYNGHQSGCLRNNSKYMVPQPHSAVVRDKQVEVVSLVHHFSSTGGGREGVDNIRPFVAGLQGHLTNKKTHPPRTLP